MTLGSDAHAAKAVGMHFDVAQKIAKTAGLTIVYYKKKTAPAAEIKKTP